MGSIHSIPFRIGVTHIFEHSGLPSIRRWDVATANFVFTLPFVLEFLMIVGLNHIAIAVPDFEEAIERFLLDFGLNFKGTEDVVSAKTKTAFFPISTRR